MLIISSISKTEFINLMQQIFMYKQLKTFGDTETEKEIMAIKVFISFFLFFFFFLKDVDVDFEI